MINQLATQYEKNLFNSHFNKNHEASLKNKKAIEKQSHKDGTQALPLSRTSYTRSGRSCPEMQKTFILMPIYLSYSLSKGLHSFCPVGVRDRISSESPGTKGEAQVKGDGGIRVIIFGSRVFWAAVTCQLRILLHYVGAPVLARC